jgi:hypothetical protein
LSHQALLLGTKLPVKPMMEATTATIFLTILF